MKKEPVDDFTDTCKMEMDVILAQRYAFCDFSNIVGFPHPIPTITEWDDYLPRFRGSKYDHPDEHLLNFHRCMLEHDFVHEDVLIKMFIFSLEEHAREWCQSLPNDNIHSLKEFHTVFHHHYKKIIRLIFFLKTVVNNLNPTSNIQLVFLLVIRMLVIATL
jgi:hypothetical protein